MELRFRQQNNWPKKSLIHSNRMRARSLPALGRMKPEAHTERNSGGRVPAPRNEPSQPAPGARWVHPDDPAITLWKLRSRGLNAPQRMQAELRFPRLNPLAQFNRHKVRWQSIARQPPGRSSRCQRSNQVSNTSPRRAPKPIQTPAAGSTYDHHTAAGRTNRRRRSQCSPHIYCRRGR